MEPTIGPNHLRDGMKLSTECPRSYLELVVSDYSAFGGTCATHPVKVRAAELRWQQASVSSLYRPRSPCVIGRCIESRERSLRQGIKHQMNGCLQCSLRETCWVQIVIVDHMHHDNRVEPGRRKPPVRIARTAATMDHLAIHRLSCLPSLAPNTECVLGANSEHPWWTK
jgi:hypothetical protein